MLPQGPVQQASLGLFAPAEMIGFASLSMRGETSTASRPIVHPELVVSQLAESLEVQQDLGLPRNDVMDYLSRPWSLESALANSIDLPLGGLLRSASKRSLVLSPLKDSNFSLNSRDGQYENGVDVEGLREALGKCRASCIFSYQCADFIEKMQTGARRIRSRSQLNSAVPSLEGSTSMKMHREDAKVRASTRKNSSKRLTNYTNRTGDSQRHLQRQKGESLTNHC
jgi:hypothetical protein